jgi:hypothetical protein
MRCKVRPIVGVSKCTLCKPMSRKRSLTSMDKRVHRIQHLCDRFPNSTEYKVLLHRVAKQRIQVADNIGKPQSDNDNQEAIAY